MKLSILFLFGLLFPLLAFSAEEDVEFRWFSLDARTRNGTAYIDLNSIESAQIGKIKVNLAILLNVFDKPMSVKTNKGPKPALSLATMVVTECKLGILTPIRDVYFDVKLPTAASKPVAAIEYATDNAAEDSVRLNKDSALYRALCPVLI